MKNQPGKPRPAVTTDTRAAVASVAFTERDRVRFEERLDVKGFDHQGIGGPQRTPNQPGASPAATPSPDDVAIKALCCERLAAMGDVDASAVAVTVTEGEVTLRGSVPAQAMAYRCEQTCEIVSGVKSIVNHLIVVEAS